MSAKAVIRMPGEGKELIVAGKPMSVLATAEDSRHVCMFEWTLPARFSTCLHVAKLATRGERPDAGAIAELRSRYDTVQLSSLEIDEG